MNLSPDGKRAAAQLIEHGKLEMYIYDLVRSVRTLLAADSDSTWSPDGGSILFLGTRNGKPGICRKASDGAGAEELVYADGSRQCPVNWSPDGKSVLCELAAPETGWDLWVLPNH